MTKYLLKLWKRLKANSFYKNIAIVASGNVTARLIGVLLTPIITRLYTPTDYGVFSVFISVIGITGSLATLRYAVTIPIAKDEKIADNLLKLCFLVTLSLSLIWVIIIAVFGKIISDHYQINQLNTYLWFIPIVFLSTGIYESLNNWAIRSKKYKLITRTNISKSVSSSSIKIGLGLLKIRPLGLFIGHIFDQGAGITSLLSSLINEKPKFFHAFSWTEIKQVAIRYKRFPLFQSWSQLLLALGAQLPILLLGLFYNAEVVGIFGLANSMISLPMNLLGQAVAQVYYGEISRIGINNSNEIYELTVSLIKRLFYIGIIPIILLALFGPWFFEIVFGDEWLEAGEYARILSVYIMFAFISAPLANVFNLYERMDLQLTLNIVRVILVGLIFATSYFFKYSPKQTIMIYSSGMVIYYTFQTFLILKLIRNNKVIEK